MYFEWFDRIPESSSIYPLDTAPTFAKSEAMRLFIAALVSCLGASVALGQFPGVPGNKAAGVAPVAAFVPKQGRKPLTALPSAGFKSGVGSGPNQKAEEGKDFTMVIGVVQKTSELITFPMKWIPSGTFQMGSPETEPGRYIDEFQHTVILTHGFWMAEHEVTQTEYRLVIGWRVVNAKPSFFVGEDRPVEMVSWFEADQYCKNLTDTARLRGEISDQLEYRLPTEAEWEYAARAGKSGIRYGELDTIAWYFNNAGGMTHPVKQKAPNAWGLYDMLGNVSEWCDDWWERDHWSEPAINPRGPSWGASRVVRGGHWDDDAGGIRAASRSAFPPNIRHLSNGFRPVLCRVR